MHISWKKKITLLISAATATSFLIIAPSYAEDAAAAPDMSSAYLQIIAKNTTDILAKVNNMPHYINQMLQYVLNMQKPDDSQATANMQANFATIGNFLAEDADLQLKALPAFNSALLGQDATPVTLPNANDLVYSTLLGQPYFSQDPRNKPGAPPTVDPAYNYIKNVSGMNIPHVMARFNWQGNKADIQKYTNYYNTVMSVESFNSFVLSNQLAESKNGNPITPAQLALVKQASNSEWISQIASEELGKVFRQILLFQSQSYVLMTQILQTQKQLLSAQAMTNTLLIFNNQTNEALMLAKAQGVRPSI